MATEKIERSEVARAEAERVQAEPVAAERVAVEPEGERAGSGSSVGKQLTTTALRRQVPACERGQR